MQERNTTMDGLEIFDYTDAGYARVMEFGAWTVALMNYSENRDMCHREHPRIERHNETDEVFVLLEGEALMIIGEEKREYVMEKNKVYNVRAGVWHATLLSKDAKLLIVENSDTSGANSEVKDT